MICFVDLIHVGKIFELLWCLHYDKEKHMIVSGVIAKKLDMLLNTNFKIVFMSTCDIINTCMHCNYISYSWR